MHRPSRSLSYSLPCVSALLIAGCGGGGGGSGGGGSSEGGSGGDVMITPPPPPPQNLQSAPAPSQPITVPSAALKAIDSSGNTLTLSFYSTPGGMATFNGQYANTSVFGMTVYQIGVGVIGTQSGTEYYLSNPYSPLGLSGQASGALCGICATFSPILAMATYTSLITSFTPFPTTFGVGESGPVSSGTYSAMYFSTVLGSGSRAQAYTVTADSPTALFLNINGAGVEGNQTWIYSVAASDESTLVKMTLVVRGRPVTFNLCDTPSCR